MEDSKLEPVFPRLPIIPTAIHGGWLGGHRHDDHSSYTIIYATVSAALVTGTMKTQNHIKTSLPKNIDTTALDTERFTMSQEFTK